MSSEYVICRHPGHRALAEIFTKEDFERVTAVDEDYEVLFQADDKEEALNLIKLHLEHLSSYTPNELRKALAGESSKGVGQ